MTCKNPQHYMLLDVNGECPTCGMMYSWKELEKKQTDNTK